MTPWAWFMLGFGLGVVVNLGIGAIMSARLRLMREQRDEALRRMTAECPFLVGRSTRRIKEALK